MTAEVPGALFCPVHPDRATRLTCTRCGRPMCPDCMVAAPVGFQCRECVAQAARTTPTYTATQAFAPGSVVQPMVTYTLVGICVVVFLLELAFGIDATVREFGMNPAMVAVEGEWYRLFTPMFMHWSILHIGFNMLVLIMLGPALERVLGHSRFLVLFLLAGLGGAVASFLFSPLNTLSVGASGAVFGLMGALVVAGRRLRYDVTQVLVLLAINLVIGFLPGGGIDWRAHIGGLVVGAAVAAVFTYVSPRRLPLQVVACAAIVLVLAAAVALRSAYLQDQFTVPTYLGSDTPRPTGSADPGV